MQFVSDSSIDGPLVRGYEEGWQWSKNKGGYNQGRDFFWVHWEISGRKPNIVKLHIESPRISTDPALNNLKHRLVEDFLSSRFKHLAEQNGFIYKLSTRTKPDHMEKHKSTSPFHIVLTDEQRKDTPQANIETVNAVLGAAMREFVAKYRAELDQHFGS